ncbi:MAG: AmmeMemoRadiSam system protein B [Sphaerochaeta sp.]|jgi:hypothetical protein|uniref:AmmeMemoRadiSam system protein B n=1 Tax=Sphaerochaeta sp. TaxID=1972642 RepID=UPI002FC97E06
MTMRDSCHHTIFYPEDRKTLDQWTAVRPASGLLRMLPSSILVPHASLSLITEAMSRSFAETASLHPELIVFLGPLHQEVLTIHEPAFLFAPESSALRIAGKETRWASTLITDLTKNFATALMQEESYFVEEPALELTLPFIQSYHPQAKVLPLLAGSCTSGQIRKYADILEYIIKHEQSTLFVVSANANALLPSVQAEEHGQAFTDALLSNANFLGPKISSCNRFSLDALRLALGRKGSWNLLGTFCQGREYPAIEPITEGTEKHVWHLCACQGASDVKR